MARRFGKRKQPAREDKLVKERALIESEVFDKPTLIALANMMKKGLFVSVDWPICSGKEAVVFRATTDSGGFLAIKIYRIETGNFVRIHEYIEGDPRFFGVSKNHRATIFAWTKKEFKNLQICKEAGVRAPYPVASDRNILVMEFLGFEGMPFNTLDKETPIDPAADFQSILDDVKKLYHAGLVHADLSEYNVIIDARGPYFIDVGQGVLTTHPRAEEFLRRDVENVLRFFNDKHGLKRDLEQTLAWIKEKPPDGEGKKDAEGNIIVKPPTQKEANIERGTKQKDKPQSRASAVNQKADKAKKKRAKKASKDKDAGREDAGDDDTLEDDETDEQLEADLKKLEETDLPEEK